MHMRAICGRKSARQECCRQESAMYPPSSVSDIDWAAPCTAGRPHWISNGIASHQLPSPRTGHYREACCNTDLCRGGGGRSAANVAMTATGARVVTQLRATDPQRFVTMNEDSVGTPPKFSCRRCLRAVGVATAWHETHCRYGREVVVVIVLLSVWAMASAWSSPRRPS